MDTVTIIQIAALIILIFLSSFFSSAETAFSTANQIKLRTKAEEGSKNAALCLRILDKYSKMLSAVLIGNNIVNLSASALATTLAVKTGLPGAVSIATGILTFVVLIFGEIVPKTWATFHADKVVLFYAGIIRSLMFILTPFIFVIDKISTGILYLIGTDTSKKNSSMTENELRTIVEASQEDGVLEEKECEMINNVFDFGDALAKDIMIPRIDMTMIEDTSTYEDVMNVFRQNMYTRIPVFHDTQDNVIGLINIKDFLLVDDREAFRISDILRDTYYTYEFKKTSDLMIEMRKSSFNIAMVLNEYGATEGMITLEDLLEEIVGEIRDEYDADEEELIKAIDDRTYIVPGNMKFDDINDSLGTNFVSEDYDSIGGLIIEHLEDKLPARGESVTLANGCTLTAIKISHNRVESVKISLPNEDAKSDDAEDESDSPA
ncbi:MAG: hemolysin family protein [Lachnospiraceae bacterium]|nr:hemolysin family protein [Lachnospiraceae bacterium]